MRKRQKKKLAEKIISSYLDDGDLLEVFQQYAELTLVVPYSSHYTCIDVLNKSKPRSEGEVVPYITISKEQK